MGCGLSDCFLLVQIWVNAAPLSPKKQMHGDSVVPNTFFPWKVNVLDDVDFRLDMYVPDRTDRTRGRQLWYLHPKGVDRATLDNYCKKHIAAVRKEAGRGATGVMVFDLTDFDFEVSTILTVMKPFIDAHRTLKEEYDKWLKCVLIITESDAAYAFLSTVFETMHKPTRPTQIYLKRQDAQEALSTLWA